ncbi:hypothetical protein GCM10009720_23080 [Yaniella flava]|uniref:DUF485 domain-containing protein n=1 Tax=Yaniella flava TaxID=287930 RepID=A0ABN2UR50_9MICC
MTDNQDPDEQDFVLDLVRAPENARPEEAGQERIAPEGPVQVPENMLAMRARRVRVATPTDVPSVQEVLLNPAGRASDGQPSTRTVRRLMRAQLRLAVSLMAWFFGLIVAVNLAFHFSPALAATTVVSIPLDWLFPAAVFIPLLIFLGWFYTRRAGHNERLVQDELADSESEAVRQ